MALCRGQALDVLRWLGERRAPFTAAEFAAALELDRRTAARWLADLDDRLLVRPVFGTSGRWLSRVRFEIRGAGE